MKIFIAHARADDDARLTQLMGEVADQAPGVGIVLGRDDYRQQFKAAGSWNSWALGVSQRHDFFVVPVGVEGAVGRATGQIVEFALQLGKPVAVFFRDGSSRRVLSVRRKPGGTAQDWWVVECS